MVCQLHFGISSSSVSLLCLINVPKWNQLGGGFHTSNCLDTFEATPSSVCLWFCEAVPICKTLRVGLHASALSLFSGVFGGLGLAFLLLQLKLLLNCCSQRYIFLSPSTVHIVVILWDFLRSFRMISLADLALWAIACMAVFNQLKYLP